MMKHVICVVLQMWSVLRDLGLPNLAEVERKFDEERVNDLYAKELLSILCSVCRLVYCVMGESYWCGLHCVCFCPQITPQIS